MIAEAASSSKHQLSRMVDAFVRASIVAPEPVGRARASLNGSNNWCARGVLGRFDCAARKARPPIAKRATRIGSHTEVGVRL